MRHFGTIFRRELSAYFNSPIAYIYIIVFLLITSGLFMSTFFLAGTANMRSLFSLLPLFLTVFIPAVTMRLWAEERKLGTIGLLLSFPIRSHVLVLGKYLAALVFYLIGLAGTVAIPLVIAAMGDPDPGPIITGYVGAALVGCLFLAVGIFISALFRDQIVAFILSILVCFAMCLLGVHFVAATIDGWVSGLGQALQKALGVLYHFSSFERGVIELGDAVFFLSFAAILLVLNTFTLDSKIKLRAPGRFYVATVFLLAIGFALNLIVSDLRLGRMDLTQGQIFTVSPATKRILSKLQVPVEVNYYVSEKEKLPSGLKDIRRDVEDKLSDLAQLSSNFTYHIYNPLADPAKIEDLEKKGIAPFQVQSIQQDSFDIKRVYSAITITYLDKKTEVIPQVVPQNLGSLEYEIMSNVFRMTLPEPPKVSMVAPIVPADPRYADPQVRALLLKMGQPMPEMRDNFQRLMQNLRSEGYFVSRVGLSKTEPLAEGTRTLVLIDPESLNERQVYEIQRFLAKGGNLIVAAQSYNFDYRPSRGARIDVTPRVKPTPVDGLLRPYGVQLDPKILMDSNMETLNVSMPRQLAGMFSAMVSMPVKLPMQIRIPSTDLNEAVSITNRISALLYLWGCALKVDDKTLESNQLKATALIHAGPSSWTIPMKSTPLVKEDLTPPRNPETKPEILGVLIEGQFPDLLEGRDVPLWPEEKEAEQGGTEEQAKPEKAPPIEKKPGKLVVIGCSEMFTDSVLGALDNRLFFQNLVDGLTLSEDLIGIRTRSQPVRYIEQVGAGKKILFRFVTIALVPLLLAAIGISRFVVRRRRRERFERFIETEIGGE